MPVNDGFSFTPSIRGIVERIAYQMGDAEPGSEYEGLDEAWIRARVFDTFKWLQGRRPDLFVSEENFKLRSGQSQSIPEQCDAFIEPLSLEVNGKTFDVLESDYEALRAAQVYAKLQPNCLNDCFFHAAVDPKDSTRFLFSPKVHGEATLTATCSNMQKFFEDPDLEIDCDVAKWINTVVEYVLYQAFSMDGGSQVSSTMADQHRTTFFDLAPVQRREPS